MTVGDLCYRYNQKSENVRSELAHKCWSSTWISNPKWFGLAFDGNNMQHKWLRWATLHNPVLFVQVAQSSSSTPEDLLQDGGMWSVREVSSNAGCFSCVQWWLSASGQLLGAQKRETSIFWGFDRWGVNADVAWSVLVGGKIEKPLNDYILKTLPIQTS